MARTVLVDAGFVVALLTQRDGDHVWAVSQSRLSPPPWITCEAVISEAFYLLRPHGAGAITALIRRGALLSRYQFADESDAVLALLEKYADVPMSFADACLVRMTETLDDPILLTTDSDFRIYRRRGRQTIPVAMPG